MLAYVFAHRPGDFAEVAAYEERLAAFHAALGAAPPAGFRGSWVWRVDGSYEDWYAVDDWAALGVLNQAAVTGERQAPHDAVAALAGPGSGAIYALVSGQVSLRPVVRWRVGKPPGVPYPAFEAALTAAVGRGAVWKRQLLLGADREFLVDAGDPPDAAPARAEVATAALELVVDGRRFRGAVRG